MTLLRAPRSRPPDASSVEVADQLRPAVQHWEDLVGLRWRQADVHSGHAEIAVTLQHRSKSSGAPPSVTDKDCGSRPASIAIWRRRGMNSSGLPEPALGAAGSIPSP